jgi:hypothetical protein
MKARILLLMVLVAPLHAQNHQIGANLGSSTCVRTSRSSYLDGVVWGPDASGCRYTDNTIYSSNTYCNQAVYSCPLYEGGLAAASSYDTACGRCVNRNAQISGLLMDPLCHTVLNPPDVRYSDNGNCDLCTAPVIGQAGDPMDRVLPDFLGGDE